MAYDVGVRSYLTGKGVPGADIGFDKNSGNVTVKGQNFYKPELNMSNTTYSNQANLDNAYNTYSKSLQTASTAGNAIPGAAVGAMAGIPKTGIPQTETVTAPKTMMSSTSTTTPSKKPAYTNPHVTQYEDIMKRLDESNKAMQQPVDIYSSPEYAAAKANQDKAAKQSTRVAQESMGASGFGRSTNLQDRAQGIQNEANDYLQTQLVPQIQNALTNKNQQQYNNLLQQFNTIYQMVNQADSQHQNEINNANADRTFDQNQTNYDKTFDYNAGRDAVGDNQWQQTYDAGRTDQADNLAINKATLTGNYENPDLVEMLRRQAENSAAYGSASPDEQKRLHDENLGFSKALGQTYDSKTGKYSDPITTARTLAGQTQDSNKQQEHIDLAQKLSEMYGVHVDPKNDPALAYKQVAGLVPLNKQKQDFDQADQVLTREHNFSNDAIQNGISQQNANTSSASQRNSASSTSNAASNSKINQLFEAWKARGTAPAGLESLGVDKGTPYAGQSTPKPVTIDPKESSNNYDIVLEDIGTTLNLKEALDLVEQNAPYLTDSDYKAAKEDARKKFEVKKDAKENKFYTP